MSREIVATTAALALLLAAGAPTFAAQKATHTPEQLCAQQAKKEHVSKSKRHAYIKSCVEKHEKSMGGTKGHTGGAGSMAPAAPAPAGE